MKRFNYLLIIVIVCISGIASACKAPYANEFDEAVQELMAASFQSDNLELIRTIDVMQSYAGQDKLAALAHYYVAFGKWQSVLRLADLRASSEEAKRLLNEAISELKTASELDANFAEAYALSINCYYPLYILEPQKSAQFAAKVAGLRNKALEAGPRNPRVVLTDAMNIFYSPAQFGGSQERGLQRFQQALRLFEKESKSANPLARAWGLEIAHAWLGNAYLNLDTPDIVQAKIAFEKSLALRPDFAWVKNIMLPQIEKQMSGNTETNTQEKGDE